MAYFQLGLVCTRRDLQFNVVSHWYGLQKEGLEGLGESQKEQSGDVEVEFRCSAGESEKRGDLDW